MDLSCPRDFQRAKRVQIPEGLLVQQTMNKLNGSLLHTCFELGPFHQKDLIHASLAFPRLARFWVASQNRASGLSDCSRSEDRSEYHYSRTWRSALCPEGTPKRHGLTWRLFIERQTTCFLTLRLYHMEEECAQWHMSFPFRTQLKTTELRSIMEYVWEIPNRVWITMNLFQDDSSSLGTQCVLLDQFLSEPLFTNSPEALSYLAQVLDLFRKTSPEKYPLFDVLASQLPEYPINPIQT